MKIVSAGKGPSTLKFLAFKLLIAGPIILLSSKSLKLLS